MANQDPTNIVRLDGIHFPAPTFPPEFPVLYTEYPTTPSLPPYSDIIERLANAHVAITTRVPISRSILASCPKVKMIAIAAIGVDMVDLEACKDLGVTVCNVPGASTVSVSEHAIAMYFALRRNLGRMHDLTSEGDLWVEQGTLKKDVFDRLPIGLSDEVACIIGGGDLGNKIAALCRGLGMTVHIAERKTPPHDAQASSQPPRPGRVAFASALQQATVVFLALPLSPETKDLVSLPEFALMQANTLLVNVSRGGIVDEAALVTALETGRIAGAATDVYKVEPAGKENSLLVRKAGEWKGKEKSGKLLLTPHLAWFGMSSIEKLRRTVRDNILSWQRGTPQNVVK